MSGRMPSKTTNARRRVPGALQMAKVLRRKTAAGLCLGVFAMLCPFSHAAVEQQPQTFVSSGPATEAEAAKPLRPMADFLGESASNDTRQVADWVVGTGDNRGLPFVIVDKKDTKVFVFDEGGHLLGATPALLGLARGDESAPGIGERKLSDIRPQERTTAAGRFVAALGPDLRNEDVLWVDYHAALALHRVLTRNSKEERLQRLGVPSPREHRITFGCINVPVPFYDSIVQPAFTGTNGIVYILPEIKSIHEVFFRPLS